MIILSDLIRILGREYVQMAFIVGITMSISGALLGVSLVLKKHSMIGDGLSHVGFGGAAVAVAFGFSPLYIAIPAVIVSSFLILKLSEKNKVFSDSAIAIFSSLALAIGYAAIQYGDGISFDVESYLYGSILGVSKEEVALSIVLCLIIVTVFVLFYNRIFSVTFDESFSKSVGVNTSLYNSLIAVLTSLTIVIGMKVMGALLITSLIIFPTLSARQIFKSFKNVTIAATILSAVSFTIGLLADCLISDLPIGSAIVFSNFIVCIICVLIGIVKNKKNQSKK